VLRVSYRARVFIYSWLDIPLLLILILYVLPYVVPQFLILNIMAWSLLAYAFSLIYGFLGYLSFGMLAYFAIGSYIMLLPLDPLINVMISIAAGGMVALIFGPIIMRFGGAYYALTNLVLSVVAYYMVLYFFKDYTGGLEGKVVSLRGIIDLGVRSNAYLAVTLIFILAFIFYKLIFNSTLVKMLIAIRENEVRMKMLGYNTLRIKVVAYVIQGMLASLGGACLTISQAYVSATTYSPIYNAEPIIAAMIGGVQNIYGPLVGTFIYLWIKILLGSIPGIGWELLVGILLIAVVLLTREFGVCGYLQRMLQKYLIISGIQYR